MKVRINLDLDTESGKWEMTVNNLSKPYSNIDYNEIAPILRHIFNDFNNQVEVGIESNERIFREIH